MVVTAGKPKKSLQLVSKSATMNTFVDSLHDKLASFAKHCFMAYWQYLQYKRLMENLLHDEILLVLDFSENYTMQLPCEVQSMHWVSVQTTLFVVVLTRHARRELDGMETKYS